jgi:hypothetical protein
VLHVAFFLVLATVELGDHWLAWNAHFADSSLFVIRSGASIAPMNELAVLGQLEAYLSLREAVLLYVTCRELSKRLHTTRFARNRGPTSKYAAAVSSLPASSEMKQPLLLRPGSKAKMPAPQTLASISEPGLWRRFKSWITEPAAGSGAGPAMRGTRSINGTGVLAAVRALSDSTKIGCRRNSAGKSAVVFR